ncbi:MAG: hypothetical protein NTZ46_03605 [Verrucomicrobia bacterium]|nr:hypothetical protein [Verrucomicrobiota bacterium]
MFPVWESLAATPGYVTASPVSVNISGRRVQWSAGESVAVIGIANGMAMVRVALPDGSLSVAQIPAASLRQKATSPLPVAVSASPAQASQTPQPTAALPPQQTLLKPGWNLVQFQALPTPLKKPKWFDYNFDPAKEKFNIYVPASYDPQKPCGVVGWTNPGDGALIPKQFQPLFDEFRLIAIAAESCGNKQKSERRAGLLVSAILQLSTTMAIDRRRVLLSGMSGGGRLSALGGFVHPEFFCGAISWCGGNFYKDYPNSEKPGFVVYGIAHAHQIDNAVTAENVEEAKKKVKFVLLTGSKDFNRIDSRDIETAMQKEHFQVLLIEEPGLGHSVGSAATMRKGLEFVLGSPAAP